MTRRNLQPPQHALDDELDVVWSAVETRPAFAGVEIMFQPSFDVITTVFRNGATPCPRMRSTSCGPYASAASIGFVPFSPLGAGLLTGKIDQTTTFDKSDFRSVVPRFSAEARAANQAIVDLLRAIAARKKATPAQVALAWLLAQKPWIVPIPGTTKLHRLEENLGAADIELTAEELRDIRAAASKIEVQGERLPAPALAMVGRWPNNEVRQWRKENSDEAVSKSRRSGVHLTAADLRQIHDAAAQIQVQGARYPAHLQARVGK